MARVQHKSAVHCKHDDYAFVVAETPAEVAAIYSDAIADGNPLMQLTLANKSAWNGRPLYIATSTFNAVTPPMDLDDDDDEGED